MYNSQLNTFLVVARVHSFNKAADKLFISPPAVVKQINALEQKLHLTLFQRTHQGLILTKSGESLYRDAEFITSAGKDRKAAGDGRIWTQEADDAAISA